MPLFLKILSFVGMIAMLWVGGGILIHGLHELGMHGPEEAVHHAAESIANLLPPMRGILNWTVSASIAAVLGLIVGGIVNPLAHHAIGPAIAWIKGRFAK
jgi:predicted DNA repair protein MutK